MEKLAYENFRADVESGWCDDLSKDVGVKRRIADAKQPFVNPQELDGH